MPAAKFFFPPGENVLDTSQVLSAKHGLLVDGPPGFTVDPGNDVAGLYANFVFAGRILDIGDMYARVREWTVSSTALQITDGTATVYARGDLSLTLKAVKSGNVGPPELITSEPDLCNHGGWYGEDAGQPNWRSLIDEFGDPIPEPGDLLDPLPPITLRFGDRIAADGFFISGGEWFCTVAARDTAGPTISFLEEFFGLGLNGLTFGVLPGNQSATFFGEWKATTLDITKSFVLQLAGPEGVSSEGGCVGTIIVGPSRYWTYAGKFDETTGARLVV